MLKKFGAGAVVQNNRGMTLVEIVIVVAILASLVAILGTQVQKQFAKAKVNQAKIQMGEIGKALDMYYTDCGSYPDAGAGLQALISAEGSNCSNWGPDSYVKKSNLQDPWGTQFLYDSDGAQYTIISLGADKREGGEGYNADITSDTE